MISTELKKIVDPNNECCCEHHLAHKVKEWAFRQGYYTSSGISFDINLWWANATPKIGGATRLETFDADNEPEAIFQAGEWILKNITSKQ